MFERIRALFSGGTDFETPLPIADAQHALGALLVRAAKADNAYLFEEVEQIDAILARLHGLNKVEAAKMRARCERLEEDISQTADLARILDYAVEPAEREAAVRALWAIVFADGIEHQKEDMLLHAVEEVLGVDKATSKRLHGEEMAKRPVKRG